jgi:putative transposase
MKADYSIQMLCLNLGVSQSGYYRWAKRQSVPGLRAQENQSLARSVFELHRQSRCSYGSPRLVAALRQQGRHHGRNRIARLMRLQGLYGRQRSRYRVRTTDSNHNHPVAPNRLNGAPKPCAPNQIWVSDITYIPTAEGWLYLAAVLDLYSRKIVGWSLSQRIDTALVLGALNMALAHRAPSKLLLHSDRGVQYASADYRASLAKTSITPSMSRRANCYDNATMESFWSTLKLELVYRCGFSTQDQARLALFDYIEAFYNRQRLHSSLNFKSPTDFESLNT